MLVGCTGFVYALAAAGVMVASGGLRVRAGNRRRDPVKITDWEDRSTCVLFGDAAGSAVSGPVEEGRGILSFSLGNDGTNAADVLTVPAGGSRRPASAETVANREHYLKMVGHEVFKFAVRAMVDSSEDAVQPGGVDHGGHRRGDSPPGESCASLMPRRSA